MTSTAETADSPSAQVPRCQKVEYCPICARRERRPRYASLDLLCGVPGVFEYAECLSCTTIYQDPCVISEDLGLCYPSAYFTHAAPGSHETPDDNGAIRAWLREAVLSAWDGGGRSSAGSLQFLVGGIVGLFPSLRQRARYGLMDELALRAEMGRCLEVGPGRGTDLRQLRRLGWHAIGLDVDPVAAANAAQFSGCDVRVGTMAAADLPRSWFDLIYMSHAVEHLPDVERSLSRCLDVLVEGGRLVLVYPNSRSLTTRRWGAHSPTLDPPRHLVLPPVEAMRALLRRIGFTNIALRSTARFALGYHCVARQYAAGRRGVGFLPGSPNLGDALFSLGEHLLTAVGAQLGEEIVAVAHKGGSP